MLTNKTSWSDKRFILKQQREIHIKIYPPTSLIETTTELEVVLSLPQVNVLTSPSSGHQGNWNETEQESTLYEVLGMVTLKVNPKIHPKAAQTSKQ